MSDLLFLIPLAIGLGVVALGFEFQISTGRTMNRRAFGVALIGGAVFGWLSSAMLLANQGKFFLILNFLPVLTFFIGMAFFFPLPPGAESPIKHGLPGRFLIGTGLVLGFVHHYALKSTASWPVQLLEFYAALGLPGAPLPAQ